MGPKLQLYKKYRISNSEVKKISEKFRTDGIELEWVIGTQTVVEEIENEENSVLPLQFTLTPFKEFARYADSKTETIDVVLMLISLMKLTRSQFQYLALAESLLKFIALEAMERYNKNEELPLENVHREFKEKMFIAQLKPGNIKDGSGNHRYIIAYYFEENAATSSFNKDSCISVQNQFLQAEEQNLEAGSSEGQRSSSKPRVRLTRRFRDTGEIEEEPTEVDDSGSSKKTKLV